MNSAYAAQHIQLPPMDTVFLTWIQHFYDGETMDYGGMLPPDGVSLNQYITTLKGLFVSAVQSNGDVLAKQVKEVGGVPLPYLHIRQEEHFVEFIRDFSDDEEMNKANMNLSFKLLPGSNGKAILVMSRRSEETEITGSLDFFTLTNKDGAFFIAHIEEKDEPMDSFGIPDFVKGKKMLPDEEADEISFYYKLIPETGDLYVLSDAFPGFGIRFVWDGAVYKKKGLTAVDMQ